MSNPMSTSMSTPLGPAFGPRAGLEPTGPATGTVVFDYTAILSGAAWYGAGSTNHPVIITYSFSAEAQPYLPEFGGSQGLMDSFVAFSEADKTLARNALAQWADASGITFVEAPAGEGDVQFGRFDFTQDETFNGFAGYAFYPSLHIAEDTSFEAELGGDVFVDVNAGNSVGLMLHEIGHALGFKHPFTGDPTLPPDLDNKQHTVMSYTGGPVSALGPFDLDAVEFLYGDAASDGSNLESWSWNVATATLTQIGTSAADTIRGVYGDDIIGGALGNDLIFGSFGTDVIEGNAGADALFGWDGDDTLKGGKQADRIEGGEGMDTFAYPIAKDSSGPAYDTIAGFDAAADQFDLHSKVRAIEATIDAGELSTRGFNTDLIVAMAELRPRDAVLFTPDAGTLAGQTFLVVDLNREAGYQAKEDLVVRLDGALNLASLDLTDFI